MITEDFVQNSFFDSKNFDKKFDCLLPGPNHQKDLSLPPLMCSSFSLTDQTSNLYKQGFFALHGYLLAYYPHELPCQPQFVVEIKNARLKLLPANELNMPYGLQIIKEGKIFEFSFATKAEANNKLEVLKSVCVLTNFHEVYTGVKMIGIGGFAKVYSVKTKASGNSYAVKAFSKPNLTTENLKAALLNEIDLLRALDHKNIMKLYEVHETNNSIYLVLELIQGKTLYEILERPLYLRASSETENMHLLYSILEALSYTASNQIMHRDLKPDNILVMKGGEAKIVDFGLATYTNLSEYIYSKCGTPGYIAPEVFMHEKKNPKTSYNDRCDVFSAGCIFFHMLHGRPLFKGSEVSEILSANKKVSTCDNYVNIRKEMDNPFSGLNKEGLHLLLQLLEPDQKKRISACEALKHPYFAPITAKVIKLSSSRHINLSPMNQSNQNHISSYITTKASENQISSNVEQENCSSTVKENRLWEKDSLYLGVDKPKIDKRFITLSNKESANPTFFSKKCDLSTVQCSNPLDKKDSSSSYAEANKRKDARIDNAQNFLKTSLLNGQSLRMLNPRKQSDCPMYAIGDLDNGLDELSESTTIESCELDDNGFEDCKVKIFCENYKTNIYKRSYN